MPVLWFLDIAYSFISFNVNHFHHLIILCWCLSCMSVSCIFSHGFYYGSKSPHSFHFTKTVIICSIHHPLSLWEIYYHYNHFIKWIHNDLHIHVLNNSMTRTLWNPLHYRNTTYNNAIVKNYISSMLLVTMYIMGIEERFHYVPISWYQWLSNLLLNESTDNVSGTLFSSLVPEGYIQN